MYWGRSASLCRIGQSGRAFQQTSIVSSSINWSQVKNMNRAGDQPMAMHGPKRMQVQKSIWRPVNAHSHLPEGHKRMKVHKSIWRPIIAQSQKTEGKENEDMATCISNGERQYSSVSNAESEISIKDCENLSGGNLASKLEVETTVASISGVEIVDAALLRFVKGKGGKVQQKIEDTTGVKLSFISTEEESAVVLDGPSTESVTAATTLIQKVLDEAVKGPNLQYSHFISLPLAVHSELKEKLTNFQNSVLALSAFGDSESASTVESSDEDSENVYEGKNVAVSLNVEENSKHVKVEMLEIPVKNEFSQKESSFSGVETTCAYPADEISDVKEAVAVKLDIEDGNVHVNLDVKGHSVRNTQAKTKTFRSHAKKNLGIDKSIFIKPATFHVTVLMLKLWNEERVAAATEVLQKVSPQVTDALEGRPLAVNLEGLELIRGNPGKAHVLYAPVKEVGSGKRLLRACRVIIDAFVEAGLVMHRDATSTLKLHATLMNTSHRKTRVRGYRRNFPFDARQIFELHGSENWGDYVIPEVHLSQRFKYDDNGYYHCCASIPFPEFDKGIDHATADITKEMDEVTTQKITEVTDKEISG